MNKRVAQILQNVGDLLELKEVKFKPEAYRRAAEEIEFLQENVKSVYKEGKLKALQEIPGVGEHIAKKIAEIIKTGRLKYYEKLKKELKVDIEPLKKIPTLGPKKIITLYKKLKIKTVKDLEQAIKKKKLQKLKGFGEKTEKTLLAGIHILKTKRRFTYPEVVPIVRKITNTLRVLPYVKKVTAAGSFRRKKATVGDLDFVIVSRNPAEVMESIKYLPGVIETVVSGGTKTSIRLKNGLQVDFRVVKEKQYGAALLYFTGNKKHNIELRKVALRKGYTLNEYGLYTLKGKKWVAGRTEKEIYQKLDLKVPQPKEREI